MLYRDLVQFTPIETIIQLRDAEKESAAISLVQSYVISDAMANKLVDMAFPQLQFERPQDNKGILIVGNYGTGKSHLMSVISAIAERAELKDQLNNEKVKEASEKFAGKFKVVRVEIGSVTRGLREILLDELQSALNAWGVSFIFPSADQVTNNKTSIIQAVAAFQEKYPGMGLLLVVDELLDYLRTREQRALILDLGFLRELGEVAASCPFRFMGGLQETLFENPRFGFVAEQLRRVKDRFEQINIAREDITFVVSQRLLKKTDAQKAQITDYLRKFAPLYKSMADRLDEFVDLFPIHPVYVETFENLAIAEKRQVLKTFSTAIRSVLDQEVPPDQPGLISYDQYWKLIQEDPSLRSIDDIARVIQKSNILEGLIQNAYTRPNLKDMAIRIIRALSVQRLATSDVFVPLGVTAESLRDGLCLFQRLPAEMNNADFLLDQVQVALKEMMKTVQGQFLSYNPENGQYYLDLKKAVDFDQKIRERGDFMDKSDLNTYFYDALRQALNLSDSTYLTGYSIWFYELPWAEHKVTRPGYLFFGPPDERTTAQPPRDFYIYFLPPFQNRSYNDQKLPDEVLFYLTGLDHEFEEKIRLYAGARSMANESTEYRTEYANKAETNFRQLMRWLQDHLIEKLHIIYQGVDEPIQSVLTRMRSTASQNIEELIRLVSSHLFSPEFEDRYPDYPKFSRLSQPVTETARANSAMEAIRRLCGRTSNLGSGILEGLGILDEQGNIRPYDSSYTGYFLKLLNDKPDGQVINRGEVIEQVAGGIQPVEKDMKFNLEPEWVSVILLALVYNGDIVISLDGREELDAGSLERALTRSMTDIINFRFYKRPRTLPINLWSMIFEGLGLQPGLVRDENTRETAVTELQRMVHAELDKVVQLDNNLRMSAQLWNSPVFTPQPVYAVEQGTVVDSDAPDVSLYPTDLLPGLRGYKQFLEELNKYTTVGKLRNLRYTPGQIQEYLDYRKIVLRTRQLLDAVNLIQPYTTYLAEAQANLPEDHAWTQRARQVQKNTLDSIRRLGKGFASFDQQAVVQELTSLKQEYIAIYSDFHRKSLLTSKGDNLRQHLYRDARFETMRALSAIDLLTRSGDFEGWKNQLIRLLPCPEFHEGVLSDSPTCPHCHLRPAQHHLLVNADVMVQQLDEKLSDLLKNWRKALRDNLNSDTAQHSLEAMSSVERKPIEEYLKQSDESDSLPANFVPVAIQALRGIQAVTLPVDALVQALKTGGLPCTREELQNRFKQFLDQQMRGHDAGNTRLTLDQ
ncbi:hypothetical protein ADN00_13050 [Ornatilinea apprima]|uniref:ATPase n=1 Tax=Ornatilinea apprima TaxID=1134406 RepID=A0A0P6XK31_9CHLR|nr:DUF6079 family protein [Ornatilinea apprima]KPL75310.1 hypothetical protein ADN00_13050 [Ornatilinea apprima]